MGITQEALSFDVSRIVSEGANHRVVEWGRVEGGVFVQVQGSRGGP